MPRTPGTFTGLYLSFFFLQLLPDILCDVNQMFPITFCIATAVYLLFFQFHTSNLNYRLSAKETENVFIISEFNKTDTKTSYLAPASPSL